jgi:hypothetical protein
MPSKSYILEGVAMLHVLFQEVNVVRARRSVPYDPQFGSVVRVHVFLLSN